MLAEESLQPPPTIPLVFLFFIFIEQMSEQTYFQHLEGKFSFHPLPQTFPPSSILKILSPIFVGGRGDLGVEGVNTPTLNKMKKSSSH